MFHKNSWKMFSKDDMQILYPKLHSADIWVFATPLYVSNMTGSMKILVDRILIPMGKPQLELSEGHCHHPLREVVENSKIVLISNCGYWELDNFDLLIDQIKALCIHAEGEFAGALLRPHGVIVKSLITRGADINDIFEAAKEAGKQLINDGKMNPETLKIVSRDLLPLESYVSPKP